MASGRTKYIPYAKNTMVKNPVPRSCQSSPRGGRTMNSLSREIFQPCAIGLVSWWNDLLRTIVARFEGQIIAWGRTIGQYRRNHCSMHSREGRRGSDG